MTTLLTIWFAGMPISLLIALGVLRRLPDEDWIDIHTVHGWAAIAVFVIAWPVFAWFALREAISER